MYEKQQKLLKKLKRSLEKRIKGIKKDLSKTRSKDWAEAAVEAENDEVLEGIFSESSQELLQVNKALQMIGQGDYGECSECGNQISKKRLKIMSFTSLCVKCAQRLEFEHINK